jgi:RNA polymerase sigma-70 factor (ECF subfamily)
VEKDLKEIIKGCIKGKADAQKQLFKLYHRKLFGVCLRYAKDYYEAEDIAQEGFVKIFKNISKLKGIESLEGWMKKIMINTALEKYRKTDKLYLVSDYVHYEDSFEYDRTMSDISSKELMDIINELSPQYKMIFNLYAIEGYTHVEISKMLGISEGTSKSNLSRARQILQEKVKKQFDTYREKKKRC